MVSGAVRETAAGSPGWNTVFAGAHHLRAPGVCVSLPRVLETEPCAPGLWGSAVFGPVTGCAHCKRRGDDRARRVPRLDLGAAYRSVLAL